MSRRVIYRARSGSEVGGSTLPLLAVVWRVDWYMGGAREWTRLLLL